MHLSLDPKNLQELLSQQWAIVAIAGILLTITVRILFLGRLFVVLKAWGREPYRQILKEYVRRAVPGWFGIAFSVATLELTLSFPGIWRFGLTRREGLLVAVIFLFLGILLHSKALCAASSTVLKRRAETETVL
ncbi:MAG TPA: hypothetical protein PKL97_06945 [Candidatus Omnitrophota bacterium]|nr:hypothetical protein [Candidatus Omnitrophota bacterium]